MNTREAATQPKQLTYRETIEQQLRALRRLRNKRLCWGSFHNRFDDTCCVLGAFNAHAARRDSIEPAELRELIYRRAFKRDGSPNSRFTGDTGARADLVIANDDFRPTDNSPEAQRARYDHLVAWCLAKLAQPESVSA